MNSLIENIIRHSTRPTLPVLALVLILAGCVETEQYGDNPEGNFDALVDIVDEHYCFFRQKDIDWRETAASYRSEVKPDTRQIELFGIMAEMLDELQDGHVNLASRFNTSYYRRWWSDYPQDFDLRTLQQYYLDFDYMTVGGLIFKVLDNGIAYIYCPSFSSAISETTLDYVLAVLSNCDKLILDIRDNGGGLLTNIDTFVGRFIDHEIPGGSITHKTGPGHDDFSKPYPFTYKPADPERHLKWEGRVALLTNRSCYSAANAFTAVMKTLPQVTVIGARTGGGGGLPMSYELPNGWLVRLSASPLYGPDGECTEFGIDPTEGFECHDTPERLAAGTDDILERAISFLSIGEDGR